MDGSGPKTPMEHFDVFGKKYVRLLTLRDKIKGHKKTLDGLIDEIYNEKDMYVESDKELKLMGMVEEYEGTVYIDEKVSQGAIRDYGAKHPNGNVVCNVQLVVEGW